MTPQTQKRESPSACEAKGLNTKTSVSIISKDTQKSNEILDAAREYVSRGFSVFPLQENGKKPAVPSWKEYQTRKTTDAELVTWFGNGNPNNYNIGIVTGAISGITVVDFDTPEAIS